MKIPGNDKNTVLLFRNADLTIDAYTLIEPHIALAITAITNTIVKMTSHILPTRKDEPTQKIIVPIQLVKSETK